MRQKKKKGGPWNRSGVCGPPKPVATTGAPPPTFFEGMRNSKGNRSKFSIFVKKKKRFFAKIWLWKQSLLDLFIVPSLLGGDYLRGQEKA